MATDLHKGDLHQNEPRHQNIHFERTDIFAPGVLITGVSVFGGIWIVFGAVYLCFALLAHHRAEVSPAPLPIAEHGNPMPPQPRLQESPRQDLKAMRTREDGELSHYLWVDKSKGTVTIPIGRAIQIVAQRGIPPQPQPANLNLSQPQAGTRLTGFEDKVEPEPR